MSLHRLSRRRFLSTTALGSGLAVSSGTAFASTAAQDVDPDSLLRFRKQLKGNLVLPGDSPYEQAKRVFYWNPRLARQPLAIVRCGHEDDLKRSIEFARDRKIEIAIRGGGHSYLAWGSSNGLVIDLSQLKKIEIDPQLKIVHAQAGVLAGELTRATSKHGLAPVLGQCPGVGVIGLTLGGGLGWLSGLYGACCDNLLSARLVNADSQTILVNDNQAPELLWGMKGAGANFGITTQLEVKLFPINQVLAGDVHYSVSDAQVVLRGFRDVMREAPNGFQANLNLTQGPAGVFISLCHVGTDAELEQMQSKIRSIAKPTRVTTGKLPFVDLAERAAVTNPANTPAPSYRAVQTVYRDSISDEVIEIIVDQLRGATNDTVFGLSHYMHGAVCNVDPGETAFPHRSSHSIHLRVAYSWNAPEEARGG